MGISSLQKARYEYAPKLPQMLRGGIAEISVSEGAETKSVADCDKIKALLRVCIVSHLRRGVKSRRKYHGTESRTRSRNDQKEDNDP